ncbi:Acid phosphatase 1 [Linum grandiflorum]
MTGLISLLLCFCGVSVSLAAADWNILHHRKQASRKELGISLNNYCESWRINVELHNIRDFHVVPEECVSYIGNYVTSTQYQIDMQLTIEECVVHISTSCNLRKDGKDAWLFDIDDTLLSTVPYLKQHQFGGEMFNLTAFEEWAEQRKAPALEHTMKLFKELRSSGVHIFLISSRRERLRSATTDNLVNVGYHGWKGLILRGPDDEEIGVVDYKAKARQQLINDGYKLWGIVADQYSSFAGYPRAGRTFKLPNPLYYVS